MTSGLRRLVRARVDALRHRAPDVPGSGDPCDRGFVLLEEIVSITLLMIVMAALATFFLTVTQSTTYERAKQSAIQLADTQLDAIRALSPADAYSGRSQTQLANAMQSNPALTPWLSTMTGPTTASGPLTLPLSSQPTANKITYTVTNYLGTCWIATPPSASGSTSMADCTATATSNSVAYLRAVVAVTWPGVRCSAGLCSYITSTLLNQSNDPVFNTGQLPPNAPVIQDPGQQQIATVGSTVSLQLQTVAGSPGALPLTWVIASGTLPAGLVLNASTGLITGSPTTAGTSSVTITATDAFRRVSNTIRISWTVVVPPTVAGLTNPFTTTAGATLTPQRLTYSCPTSNCTETLTGAPGGIGLATTAGGPFTPSVTVSDTGTGSLYLGGVVDSTTSGTATAATTYAGDVVAQGATHYWRLGETSGTTGVDAIAGGKNLLEQAGVGHTAPGAITPGTDGAATFDGSAIDGLASTQTAETGPQVFTESVWFKTTTTSGGKLLGFGNGTTGISSNYDRQIYMDNSGALRFGTCGSVCPVVITTTGSYNDGQWHQAVGTLSSAGLSFYVDGQLIGTNTSVTTAQGFTGFWRLGGDNLAGWAGTATSNYFAGTLDDVSIYPTALTATQIAQQYSDSGRSATFTIAVTPVATATASSTAVAGNANTATWTVNPPPTVTGLTNPFSTTAGATIANQVLPYTCPTSSCSYALAGAPKGIGLSAAPTGAGPFPTTVTVTGSPGGNLYLRGTVDPAAATSAAYSNDVASQGATNSWHLNETSGSSAADAIGSSPLTEGAGVGHGGAGAILTAPGTAATFDGSSSGTARSQVRIAAPSTFSESIWFKTTTTSGGQLIGFGDSSSDARSSSHDRQLYMDTAGRITFGVSPSGGVASVVVSTASYNDGAWHQAVATMQSGTGGGQSLYIDGRSVGTPQAITTTTPYNGYWRLGGDDLSSWPAGPASNFAGSLDEAAVYATTALTAAQIQQQYADSLGAYAVSVTPTDTVTGFVGVPNKAAWTVNAVPTVTGMVTPFATTAGATIATQPLPYTCPSTSCTETLTGAPTGIGLNVADTGSPQGSVATTTTTSGNVFLRGTVDPAAGTSAAYATDVQTAALGATNYWRLGEASGTTGTDQISGGSNLVYGSGVGHGVLGAIATSPDTASTFSGAADYSGTASSQATVASPAQLTESIWFKTTSTTGGWLLGLTDQRTGSSNYDRALYLDNAGHVDFELYTGSPPFLVTSSPGTYNDGAWHQAVVTVSPTAGVSVYVDGTLASVNAGYRAITVSGVYWRLGGGGRLSLDLTSQTPISSNTYSGSLDEAAVFSTVLSANDVSKQYLDARRVAYSLTATPTDTTTGITGPVNAATWSVRPAPAVSGLVTPFSTTVGATIAAQPLGYSCPSSSCTLSVTGAPAGVGLSATTGGSGAPSLTVAASSGTVYLVGTVGAGAAGSSTVTVTITDTLTGVAGSPVTAAWTVYAKPTVTGLVTPFATTGGAKITAQPLTFTCPTATCVFTLAGAPGGIALSTSSTASTGSATVTVTTTNGTIYLVGTSSTSASGPYSVAVTPTDTNSNTNGPANTASWTVGPPTVTGLVTPFATTGGARITAQPLTFTCPTATCGFTLAGAPGGIGLSTSSTATTGSATVSVTTATGTIYLVGTSSTVASGPYTVTVTPRDTNSNTNGPVNTATWTVGPPTVTGLVSPFSTTAGATITAQPLTFTCPTATCTLNVAGAPAGIGLAASSTATTGSTTVTVSASSGTVYLVGTSSPSTAPGTYTVIVTPRDTNSNTNGSANTAIWTVVGPPTVTGLVTPFSTTAGAKISAQSLPYSCPTASCTFSLAGSPAGINLSTTPGGSGAATVTVTGSTSGNVYLVGTVAAGAGASGAYVSDVPAQGGVDFWRLGEASGTTGVDSVGTNNLIEQAGVGHGAAGAVRTNSDAASTFNGTTNGYASTQNAVAAPTTFSESIWFRTTTTAGGKLLGFGTAQTGNSGNYDKHLYMDNAGHLLFGVYAGRTAAVTTSATLNDGQWHQAVGILSSTNGISLYVDGQFVASDATAKTQDGFAGYWRVGGDTLAGWPSAPTSNYFAGSLDDAAIYSTALTAAQVAQQYADANAAPYTLVVTPSDTASGVTGVPNQAAWRVSPPPTVSGLTTPFATTVGATIATQTLPYTCPTSSCTVTATGLPANVGISTTSTGGALGTTATVTAPGGVLYLRGTVGAGVTPGTYTVAVTATDTTTGAAGPPAQATWTVNAAPTVTGLPSSASVSLGQQIPVGYITLTYSCPSLQCTFAVGGGLTGIGLATTPGGIPTASVSVTSASGSLYVGGTVAAVGGTYTVSVTPTDTSTGVTGPPNTAVVTVIGPTVTGQTAPLTTSVGATIANDAVSYTCPSGNCTFAVTGGPSGIGLYTATTGATSGTPSVTVTSTSGTLYLRGTIAAATPTGTSTVGITYTENTTGVSGLASSSTWTLKPAMVLTAPAPLTMARLAVVSKSLTYTCQTSQCTVSVSGAPSGIGLSTAAVVLTPSASLLVNAGTGTLYLGGTVVSLAGSGPYLITLTEADPAGSTITSTVTWTVQ